MTIWIAFIVLISAVLQPLWNALLKRYNEPQMAFLFLSCFATGLSLAHSLVVGASLVLPLAAIPFLLLSSAAQVLYGVALARALQGGDISLYYPIIRSYPIAIMAFAAVFGGATYSTLAWFGSAMVVVGIFMMHFPLVDGSVSLNAKVLATSVIAMVMAAIYSIADAKLSGFADPPVVMFWTLLLTLPCLVALRTRDELLLFWRAARGRKIIEYVAMSACAYVAYLLVIVAYRWGGDPGLVNSIRQIAIPLGVLMGSLFYSEADILVRLKWSAVIAAGISTIVVG